ncbi:BlaI/MecI/CopY family transcriptional regulator [Candidatus Atelocyanobacterium thalassae]|mgnify:CR=1 FL=1|jgi:predicted transcriptional regulator|uniref:Transcriptional repressor, CopY family n=1 Tax=Atelocyanobacterium thalassa (isolate ALOHA) TaxID=1453429 RepID=D3EQ33_ATETH|nr:BlaI/MecI/CopY family transcriptional regulator [Candidatus Atelocyanobacterium thalassa]ADB95583.1 transcriptional repressor, CopY family [Candidatus Atelocyanobacterium thalassa isolate ALOHA]MCH2543303.1 BlaI/MecI/CopY family transcriptional regulator [Candidatus Atelocyanobacterium sp. ALOHA_A2.5_9]|tara:strand:+ start:1159 stop:1578 length:420 start_codon:yes stop_codon:yes gene_type:complete
MSPLPQYRPHKLSLGSLETEILEILWDLEKATVKQIHDCILSDLERELAYASVTTVLNRLTKKGWLKCCKQNKAFSWEPLVSREQTNTLRACEQLQQFLAISNPNMVASLVDSLDTTSLERLELIAANLQAIRHQREIK